MRVETLWQGDLRTARFHWWSEVLNRPNPPASEEMFDEALVQRFRFVVEPEVRSPVHTPQRRPGELEAAS